MRIAMWSGPRNLSTAMMYSFAQRRDAKVVDEPLYGVYLRRLGVDHPMRDAVLASMVESEDEVIRGLLAPRDCDVFYQKHMCHHLLPGMRRDWIEEMTNVFLIRHPARVIASYGVKRAEFGMEDLGFAQQEALFDALVEAGQEPIVIDSFDIRQNPRAALSGLCEALGIPFDEAMLSWPVGGNAADGAWAPHWYEAVRASTGFAAAEKGLPEIPARHQAILEESLRIYEKLSDKK